MNSLIDRRSGGTCFFALSEPHEVTQLLRVNQWRALVLTIFFALVLPAVVMVHRVSRHGCGMTVSGNSKSDARSKGSVIRPPLIGYFAFASRLIALRLHDVVPLTGLVHSDIRDAVQLGDLGVREALHQPGQRLFA